MGNILYGVAGHGGSSGKGTVFAINKDGTGFTNLYSFTALLGLADTNSDGAYPISGLASAGNTLYGTAPYGGSSGNGTLFRINIDGSQFTNLHNFTPFSDSSLRTNADGARPFAGLVLSGDTLYGTTVYGGSFGSGTVFRMNIDGTSFTNLYAFPQFQGGPYPSMNSDGAFPAGALILSSNTLFGTAKYGGSAGNGTIFKINTDGAGFTVLHAFDATRQSTAPINSDGGHPVAGLLLTSNTLFGTTLDLGISSSGTLFKINTEGTGFAVLHSFSSTPFGINSDGAVSSASLILLGDTLYGAAQAGGSSGNGTVFALNTDGTRFKVLHTFTEQYSGTTVVINYGTNIDGAVPYAGLILSGNALYGTATYGGISSFGTVFSLTLPPPNLSIIVSGPNLILTWLTNYTGFTLQSTTNLVSQAWTTNSPAPVIVNGQNTVTNPISGTQRFFRLSQ